MGDRTKLRFYVYPALLIAAIGAVLSVLNFAPGIRAPGDAAGEKRTAQPGKDYYVSVALIELTERDQDGNSWDSFSESGPDISVQILWNGSKIYQSTTKQDTFIAKWSNAELNLRDIAMTGERTSMDDVIRAARVNVKAGEYLELRAYDSDLMSETLAGTKTFLMTDLLEGDTTYTYDTPGIKRLTLRVSDMTQTVDPLR